MKKIYLLMMVCLVACLTWSCSDDDKDEVVINEANLPQAAQTFIKQFYPNDKVARVTKDTEHANSEYEVKFVSGQEVEFDAAGQWTDVSAPRGMAVPTGIVPEINIYVGLHYDGAGINEISRDQRGYEVELINGLELLFNPDLTFAGVKN
ncbi:MAG: PepSY-like domain-containing protein [Staphylococcus sp.]|nr:PepSY-like domain-containing protein [Staphylococcus sp.]